MYYLLQNLEILSCFSLASKPINFIIFYFALFSQDRKADVSSYSTTTIGVWRCYDSIVTRAMVNRLSKR